LTDAEQTTITNWDATNESEDVHDSEHMKKKAQMTSESKALTTSHFLQDCDVPVIDSDTGNSFAFSTDFASSPPIQLV
jgi:hypothetical protein